MSRSPTSSTGHGLVAVLLAAGSGSRFGSDKLMHAMADGMPIAIRSARNLRLALPDAHAVAVVRPRSNDLARLLMDEGFDVVTCERAADGMGHSLADATCRAAERATHRGLIVALADMPFVRASTLVALADALLSAPSGSAPIAAPTMHGRRGNPVAFGWAHSESLMALTGDEGARRLVKGAADSSRLVAVEVDDPGIFRDIDRPSDLDAPA